MYIITRASLLTFTTNIYLIAWAIVVAQLAEQLLPTPEVHRSNPDIGKLLDRTVDRWKDNITEKEAGNGPFLTFKNV